MPHASYRILEHTADLRVEFRARDLEALLEVAARGLFELLLDGPLPEALGSARVVEIPLTEEPDLLLRNWLSELLYLHETEHEVYPEFRLDLRPGALRAEVRGRPSRDLEGCFAREIKAVTYHGLLLEEGPDGLRAEVIFDL